MKNKLIKIMAILSIVALAFLAILAKIQLAEGGEFLSEKKILFAAIFVFGLLILLLLNHIVDFINKKKSGS